MSINKAKSFVQLVQNNIHTVSKMKTELTYTTIIIIIFFLISGYWCVVFVKRIYLSRNYKRAVERNLRADPSDYISEQYNNHYQTEIRKYVLLLLITFAEITVDLLSYSHLLMEEYDPFVDSDSIYRRDLESCTSVNNSVIIDFELRESSVPLLTLIRALRNVTELVVPGLLTYLMSYLIGRMKKSRYMNIRKYILIILPISMAIVITSYYTFLIALSKAIYLLAIAYYYIMLIIYVKRFKQALLQLAIERLAQYGSNGIEMKQYRYFCYTINCVCIGLHFIIAATYLGVIARIMVSFIFFGRCVFPTSFIPQLIDLESLNSEQVTKLFMIFYYINELSSVCVCIGTLLAILPIVFITIGIWIRSAYRMVRRKPSVQFKYTNVSSFEEESTIIQ